MQEREARELVGEGEQKPQRHAAYFGMFLALAMIFSYIESLLPLYVGVPGIKLGLANVVIVVVLYYAGAREAFLLAMARNVLSGLLFSGLPGLLYSAAGSICSIAGMSVCRRRHWFQVTGVSMIGGVCHNIGQLLAAMAALGSVYVLSYLPALLAAGTVTGALIGIAAGEVQKHLHI